MISNELAAKLAKLIPLLASDKDGEVLATARAINTSLASAGLDLHDLTKALVAPKAFDQAAYEDAWARTRAQKRNANPEGACEEWGVEVDARGFQMSWKDCCEYLMKLNRTIPKRYGGKCLEEHQIRILQRIYHGGTPTNAEACAIERMMSRVHTARDAQKADEAARARAA